MKRVKKGFAFQTLEPFADDAGCNHARRQEQEQPYKPEKKVEQVDPPNKTSVIQDGAVGPETPRYPVARP